MRSPTARVPEWLSTDEHERAQLARFVHVTLWVVLLVATFAGMLNLAMCWRSEAFVLFSAAGIR